MLPRNLHAIDLNLLKVFVEIERQGSVTGAADVLGLGQPAVSQALSRLRDTLSDDLFVRGPGGMTATPRALELIGPLRMALAQIEETVFGAQAFDPGATDTRFRIGASDYAAALLVPKLKTKMAVAMPHANLAVIRADRSDAEHLLSDGQIDLALGMFPTANAWMRRRRLFEEKHVCVFNPELLDLPDPLSAVAYARCEHMLVSLDGSPTGFVDTALAQLGLERRVSLTTPYFLQSAYLLERLPLMATLPERFVRGCSSLSRMRIRALPFETPGFTVSALWRAADERSPRFQALRESVLAASSSKTM